MVVVGVDGCPGGWFAVTSEDGALSGRLHSDFGAALEAAPAAAQVFVDVPIGLAASEPRGCDQAARRLLGCRAATVFTPPCRSVLEAYQAGEIDSYAAANAQHRSATGRGLSRQAWHLVPKIAEVDAALAGDTAATSQPRVVESHPECCFLTLDGAPLGYGKTTALGTAQRRAVLAGAGVRDETEHVYAEALAEYPRGDVGRDDVLDAVVLAVVAAGDRHVTLPTGRVGDTATGVPTDPVGLPMRIVYGGPPPDELFAAYREDPTGATPSTGPDQS